VVQRDGVPDDQGDQAPRLTGKTAPSDAIWRSALASQPLTSGAKKARHLPGEEGIWLFILGDMMVFALFFLTFVYYRGTDISLYVGAQRALNERFGLINTLFLLSSSWCVAMAIRALRRAAHGGGEADAVARRATLLLGLAMLFGVAFVVLKVVEYQEKFAAGITVLTNEFFMFYFMFTSIHLVHVLIGLGVLTYLLVLSRTPAIDESDVRTFESGAAFWHLVDLLWVILFALLYLMR
jgi:nitric oxide reductase NorE protein